MKTFVKVRCDFEFGGRITPLLFRKTVRPFASTASSTFDPRRFRVWAARGSAIYAG